MSRFQHVILSFWRKDQGLGMIEAAVALPVFLLFAFGVIEFGSMYMEYSQSREIANDVGQYLQANPEASSSDLELFVTRLELGRLVQHKNTLTNNPVFPRLKIKSQTTIMTAQQFDAFCASGGKDWSNPWANNANNLYYIHICHPFSYRFITPLSKLTGGALPETRTIRSKAVVSTYPTLTCPAGSFVNNNSGRPECTTLDAPCNPGEYLVGVRGTTGVCETPFVTVAPQGNTTSNSTNDCWGETVMVGMQDARHVNCAPMSVGW
jgi:Flp pilus assembly protein TadG